MTTVAPEAVLGRLVELMRTVAAVELPAGFQFDESAELQAIPITSRTMRTFLVAVEDAFDHEWDIDTPAEVFTSFQSLADYLSVAATKEAN